MAAAISPAMGMHPVPRQGPGRRAALPLPGPGLARRLLGLLALVIACLLAGCTPGDPAVMWLTSATRQAVADPLGPATGAPEPITLPDSWSWPGRAGTWDYSLTVTLAETPTQAWALLVPRAGNRLMLWLDGQLVGQLGEMVGDQSDHVSRPHLFFLPPSVLQAGTHRLTLRVQGERARYAGLSTLYLGPQALVRPAFLWRELLQPWATAGLVLLASLLGLVGGAMALALRDRLFGLFAAACLCFALRNCQPVLTEVPIDYRLWGALTDTAYAGYLGFSGLFIGQALGLDRRPVRWLSATLLLATATLLPWHAIGREVTPRQLWLQGLTVYALVLCALVAWRWWRHGDRAARPMALGGAVMVALGLHDHLTPLYQRDGYGGFGLARYSLLALLLGMAWVLIERYRQGLRHEAALQQRLAFELRQRTEALAQQQQAIGEQVRQQERQRILLDIHDGMGLQLNALLSLVQTGSARPAELHREVRTAIEQMRMLVDSSERFDGDLAMLLGQLRHVIGRRLRQAGLALDWTMALPQLGPQRVRPGPAVALQRLLFELTTNVLKHAEASTVRLRASETDDGSLQLLFEDDGRGFPDGGGLPGHGLRSVPQRLQELDGQGRREARPGGGTVWRLLLGPGLLEPAGPGAAPPPAAAAPPTLPSSGYVPDP